MLNRLENMENSKVELEIEISSPEVDTALARAYRMVVQKVNLPGFRKGKVPRRILESRFGPEVLHEEALEILVPPAYQQALEESKVEAIGKPDFELLQLEEGKPLIFKAVVEVLPPVELGEYRGLEAEREQVIVDDLQVDHHLYMLREQNARLVPREEGEVREGDLVTLDFKGFISGEAFEGGEAENYSLEIGSNSFIPGFEQQLIGVAAGEEKEIQVKFPDGYQKEDLAGKDAVFQVKIREIKEKQLPDLDEEFVQEVSEFETIEEMKVDLKEKMQKNAEERSQSKMEEQLIGKITAASVVEPPETLVERQVDRMIGEMENYLRYQGMGLEQFLELSGKKMEELRAERREEALLRTKANLVLDAIAKKEGITVTDSELEAKVDEIAETYNDERERIWDILEKQGRIPVMREELRVRKVVDLLVEEARVALVAPSDGAGDAEPAAGDGYGSTGEEQPPAEQGEESPPGEVSAPSGGVDDEAKEPPQASAGSEAAE